MPFTVRPASAPRASLPTAGLIDSPDANDNTDVWNNMVLLQRLAGIPVDRRAPPATAACWWPRATAGPPHAEGSVEGIILEAPRGTGGFGYDPLFYLPELDRTMAEIDLETKLSLSHRGRAFAAFWPSSMSRPPDSRSSCYIVHVPHLALAPALDDR